MHGFVYTLYMILQEFHANLNDTCKDLPTYNLICIQHNLYRSDSRRNWVNCSALDVLKSITSFELVRFEV